MGEGAGVGLWAEKIDMVLDKFLEGKSPFESGPVVLEEVLIDLEGVDKSRAEAIARKMRDFKKMENFQVIIDSLRDQCLAKTNTST